MKGVITKTVAVEEVVLLTGIGRAVPIDGKTKIWAEEPDVGVAARGMDKLTATLGWLMKGNGGPRTMTKTSFWGERGGVQDDKKMEKAELKK
ncbi:hypothetical protein SESBI_40770 [Sesbania bispinosa]|nr:hypothetical protein SESBI_40770 [Sesbania bispinosa]